MNTKHTPGPWARNISAKYPVYAESNHRKVATALSVDGMDGPETMANLRLIAAAPELLAALQDACASLEVQAATHRYWATVRDRDANNGLADEIERNVRTYRAAIAKATGQEG